MTKKDLGLISRGGEFKMVIDGTTCTDANGNIHLLEEALKKFIDQLHYVRTKNNAIYLIGNGGSAGVASHALTDFLNVCRLRAYVLHESSLITCMANDFGYENAYARILNTVMCPGDMLIGISSSGKSLNICNAAKIATEKNGIVITLSGFKQDNPLRKLGDLNFWLDSCDYGLVEIGHAFILHNISDRIGVETKNMQTTAMKETI
ncbi:MAG: phosphoheptose isomerase [uncultured bacterium]|nr:MAG: phosphoheptose isomerase [uncultured bacterium]